MPSKQSEAVRRHWESAWLTMTQPAAGRAPEADDAIRTMADWVRSRLGL
jgi:hypothetical protein